MSDMEMQPFGAWNYVVVFIMLAISSGVGLYYRFTGGKQKTTGEYLLADGTMSIFPVACSLMASFMSAITILGVSKEIYAFGTQYVMINISYGIFTPIAAYGFLPVFYKMKNLSVYEYLERRFGKVTRVAASLAFSLQMILYMGIVLYAPALALSAVTALSKIGALLSVGLVCTFYSALGGMKAVLITDMFQTILMLAAVLSVLIKGTIDAGGFQNVWEIAKEGGRIEFFDFHVNPTIRHTFWSLTIGGMFTCLSLYAVNQAQVQRLLTVKSLKKSQQAMWLNWPILSAVSISTAFTGLVIYARYYNCDPLAEGRIDSIDQLMPLFVMDSMGHIPGLPGLFVAGIFSGTLSTVSSAVNSLAAVTVEDYLKPLLAYQGRPLLSDRTSTIWTTGMSIFYGLLCIGIAFLAEHLGGVLQAALTIFGVVGGPLFGLFTLGMFFWVANETGAVTGLLCGLAIAFWIGFGGPKPPLPYLPVSTEGCNATTESYMLASNVTLQYTKQHEEDHYFLLYRISYMYYVVVGFLVTLIVGLIVSIIQQKVRPLPLSPIDKDLYSPFIKRFVPGKESPKHSISMDTKYESPEEVENC